MNKKRETWAKIIDVFKELPYLWDKKHKDYFNRDLKQEGFNNLLLIHNEGLRDNELNLGEFKKKIENMRATYARELKKVTDSKQTGSGLDGIYNPTLWYYTLFDFLQETNKPCRTGTDSLNEITNVNTDRQSKDIKPSSNDCEEDEDPPRKKQRMTIQKNKKKFLIMRKST